MRSRVEVDSINRSGDLGARVRVLELSGAARGSQRGTKARFLEPAKVDDGPGCESGRPTS